MSDELRTPASAVMVGVCVKCASPIQLLRVLRPCDLIRITCARCKRNDTARRSRKWRKSNAKYLGKPRRTAIQGARKGDYDKIRNERSKRKATMARQPWGEVEEVWLLENAAGKKVEELAVALGRSIKAVEARLFSLRHVEGNQ